MTVHTRAFALRDQWAHDAGMSGDAKSGTTPRLPVALWSAGTRAKADWQIESSRATPGRDGSHGEVVWRTPDVTPRCAVRSTVPSDFPVVTWTPTLVNDSETTTDVYEDWLSLDAILGAGGDVTVRYAVGSVASLDDFAPRSQTLQPGESLRLQPGGGRSSSEILPYFLVDLGETAVIVAVAWTGEWRICFENLDRGLHVTAGVDETRFKMLPGESLTGPGIALLFWSSDLDVSPTNLWRRYVLAHHRPQSASGPVRPALSCATWGATPDRVHAEVIEQLGAERLPFETYWIDAGWFGGPDEWWRNVGSWSPYAEAWPDGFRAVADQVHAQGRKFLLWFEPERAAPLSEWDREHPEWMLRVPAERRIAPPDSHDDPDWVYRYSRHTGNQPDEGLFDLGNPDALEFLIDFVSERIERWGIDVYRNDFNVAPLEFWRAADDDDRVGVTQLRYVAGLYRFFDELTSRHPHLEIDNCASGGRRLDLNMLGRAVTQSRSDYLQDPVGHQCQNYGLSTWVPLHATLPHSGFGEYALRSAYSAGLSVSWATGFNEPESGPLDLDFEQLRERLAEFESVRDCFLGDFHPLTPFTTSSDEWLAYQFHDPSRNGGVALAFRRPGCESATLTVRLAGLVAEARYLVRIDAQEPIELSGADLSSGLVLTAAEAPAAILVTYTDAMEVTR